MYPGGSCEETVGEMRSVEKRGVSSEGTVVPFGVLIFEKGDVVGRNGEGCEVGLWIGVGVELLGLRAGG